MWFCGRKSHRVRTAKGDLYTEPIERVFDTHPRVRRTALVGIGPAGAQTPVLCVELERSASPADWTAIRTDLESIATRHPVDPPIRQFLLHPKFPVDVRHNAKIFRESLAEWAQEHAK